MSCEFTLTWTDANGDTLVLTDPDTGIEMMLGGIGFDVPPMSNTTAGYVSLDGSTLVKRRRDARPLTFGLYIRDAVRLRTVVSDVARALQGPGVLTFDDDTNVRSLFNVIYDGGLEGEWSADMGLQRFGWRKLVVSMLALNPWWHDEETSATINTAQSTDFDDAGTLFDDPDVAFDGSSETTVAVLGDATALPVWTITGPSDELLVGLQGGQSFVLAAALADGDVITVDTRPGNRGPRLNDGEIDWSLLTPSSRLWELPVGWPVVVAGATGTDGGSAVTVAFRQRWLTP
jgi:hypothetical protein